MTGVSLYECIKESEEILSYIRCAGEAMKATGFTEHSFVHVTRVAEIAKYILAKLGYPAHEIDLAQTAGYLHDIGNLINRKDHAQTGALMAFQILTRMDVSPLDIATITMAIGNHDEATAVPINAVTAALILGDKTDVRRSRVQNPDQTTFDIHDRVNYSVTKSSVKINEEKTLLKLKLTVDTRYGSVMDYFEIFLQRMILCRKACEKLDLQFKLIINEQQLL